MLPLDQQVEVLWQRLQETEKSLNATRNELQTLKARYEKHQHSYNTLQISGWHRMRWIDGVEYLYPHGGRVEATRSGTVRAQTIELIE